MYRDRCRLHVNILPFYIRDLSVSDLGIHGKKTTIGTLFNSYSYQGNRYEQPYLTDEGAKRK